MATPGSSTTIIGRFEVTEDKQHELGRGSYGTVYLAKDLENDENPVAAKKSVIYKEYMKLIDWSNEGDMLRKISRHENLVEIYHFDTVDFVENGIPMMAIWLITEVCDKGSLQSYAYVTDLSLCDKLDILLQSGHGVDHLHRENVIHRDLKPQNILISGSAPNIIIKLCDFGEARDVLKVNEQSVAMRTINPFGTWNFMAPEQTAQQDGKFVYKRNVDIFAFGITGLTLLNCQKEELMKSPTVDDEPVGKMMWQRKTNLTKHFEPSIDNPTDNNTEKAAKKLMKDMIQYTPDDRPTIAQVVSSLSALKEQVVNISDYEITVNDKLGKGYTGSGVVYLGQHIVAQKQVAAKRYTEEAKKKSAVALFENELNMLENVLKPHENTVQVYCSSQKEYNKDGKQMVEFWIIMELCHLGNLYEYAKQRRLTVKQKLELMIQSSRAVHHLHNKMPVRVVHRRINPCALLVSGSSEMPIIKLCNFKYATTADRDGFPFSMESYVGAPAFRAPEQTRRDDRKRLTQRVYDHTVDSFALGISCLMLLEAVMGTYMEEPKVDGQFYGRAMWERRNSGFQPSIKKPSDSLFVTAIKDVISDMIKFRPADRPSAQAVLERFEALQASTQRIGEFEVVKNKHHTLTSGKMVTVYLGEDMLTKEQVAVKEVTVTTSSKDDIDYRKFKEQGKTAQSIPPHKNVLTIHAIQSEQEKTTMHVSLVTEMCTLGNLQEHVQKNDLTLGKKLDIMIECTQALAHLHKNQPQSMLYRDICPDNILLSGTAIKPIAKLCPVSVTRAVKPEEDEAQWYYKAPEQTCLRGNFFLHDKNTEIFSLGMTNLALLEAPNRSTMVPRTENGQSLAKVMMAVSKTFSINGPHICKPSDNTTEKGIKNIISQMLQFEPANRITAAQVVGKLMAVKAYAAFRTAVVN